jgi:putative Holliday junction resolvase
MSPAMPECANRPQEAADGLVMAFDFGTKRIGVAIGETLLSSARPLMTIEAEAKTQRFSALDRLISEWRPARLVVGRPAHADRDAPHPLAARCERFARQLAGRYHLPVDLIDERYTSCVAAERTTAAGRKTSLDAAAAAIILQSWFDAHAADSSRR